MRICPRCGTAVIYGRGRKRCKPCAKIVYLEQTKLWRKLHPESRSIANHKYYVQNRKNNPFWIEQNKLRARLWRARQET